MSDEHNFTKFARDLDEFIETISINWGGNVEGLASEIYDLLADNPNISMSDFRAVLLENYMIDWGVLSKDRSNL